MGLLVSNEDNLKDSTLIRGVFMFHVIVIRGSYTDLSQTYSDKAEAEAAAFIWKNRVDSQGFPLYRVFVGEEVKTPINPNFIGNSNY